MREVGGELGIDSHVVVIPWGYVVEIFICLDILTQESEMDKGLRIVPFSALALTFKGEAIRTCLRFLKPSIFLLTRIL